MKVVKRNKLYILLMNMMSKMMLSCESAGMLICKKQHETLKLSEKINLKLHLLSCRLCRRFEQDIIHVNTGIDHYKEHSDTNLPEHKLDDNQKDSIRKKLEAEIN